MTARARAWTLVNEWRTTNGAGIGERDLLQALIEVLEEDSGVVTEAPDPQNLAIEIERLAVFLTEHFADQIGQGGSESAVDVAIRLLRPPE